MRPFNLEEAKAGKPIIDRDGDVVEFIGYAPRASEFHQVAFMNKEGYLYATNKDGFLCGGSRFSRSDVFMAPEKKEYWVNLYRVDGSIKASSSYPSIVEAKKNIWQAIKYVSTVKVYEETI